jgi:hypothetical protein
LRGYKPVACLSVISLITSRSATRANMARKHLRVTSSTRATRFVPAAQMHADGGPWYALSAAPSTRSLNCWRNLELASAARPASAASRSAAGQWGWGALAMDAWLPLCLWRPWPF